MRYSHVSKQGIKLRRHVGGIPNVNKERAKMQKYNSSCAWRLYANGVFRSVTELFYTQQFASIHNIFVQFVFYLFPNFTTFMIFFSLFILPMLAHSWCCIACCYACLLPISVSE